MWLERRKRTETMTLNDIEQPDLLSRMQFHPARRGDPMERDPDFVAADVRDGYVSRGRA
jgi:hypothetical protein